MTILDIKFPENLSMKARGGAEYQTAIIPLAGGGEQRSPNWGKPRHKFVIKFNEEDASYIEQLISFFHLVKGRLNGFKFRDWNDCVLKNEIIGTGNGMKTEFQIAKNYVLGSSTTTRNITKPANGITVYIDSVLISSGVSVNYDNGKITFTTPPANGKVITVSGEFDVPVRFENDWLDVVLDMPHIKGSNEVKIIEVLE
jgi:uncharacterized protein (TIGR02217 family)